MLPPRPPTPDDDGPALDHPDPDSPSAASEVTIPPTPSPLRPIPALRPATPDPPPSPERGPPPAAPERDGDRLLTVIGEIQPVCQIGRQLKDLAARPGDIQEELDLLVDSTLSSVRWVRVGRVQILGSVTFGILVIVGVGHVRVFYLGCHRSSRPCALLHLRLSPASRDQGQVLFGC